MSSRANATDKTVPVAFRIRESDRLMLTGIQKRVGHRDLSETLREAVLEYLDRYTARRPAA